jgi:hypothetical protein
MSRLVSLLFDVEDPFDPAADDAALTVAEVVRAQGVRGTFCVTGDKCRRLMERGRADVIEALKHHALGIHTDRHSLHPTTMEMLEDKGWEDGVAAALESEGRALHSFEEAFGRKPCCWGGGGNTWGPQIHGALKELGVPAVVYSQIAVPGGLPHEFLGVRSFPSFAYLGEDNMERADTAEESTARTLAAVKGSAAVWCEVFSGHPTRYRHTDWWDGPFYDGQTPEEYTPAPTRPQHLFESCMENLGKSIRKLSEELTVLGLDDVLKLEWTYRELSAEEAAYAREKTAENVRGSAGWPPNRRSLDPSRIVQETLKRLDTLRIAVQGLG